jgi:serine/threonine protein kinase
MPPVPWQGPASGPPAEMFTDEELQDALPDGVALGPQIKGGKRLVYEAEQGGERIVIKLMPHDQLERAEREVTIGCTFDHPNLARILDTEVCEDEIAGERYVWFSEEFIEGEPLSDRSGKYTPCEALALAADLTAAVEYLWENHTVVHRDIKPLNVIRRPDGTFVLIDVGSGRHQLEDSITSGALGPGTNGHLAPEQLELEKGHDFDSRTDLFLIGIVVFQALTDVRPFRPERGDYIAKLLSGDWPRPQGLPPALLALLERLLARRLHQRPTIEQAKRLIAEAKEESGCS